MAQPTVKYHLDGVNEINNILKTIPAHTTSKIMRDLYMKSSKVVKQELLELTPVGKSDVKKGKQTKLKDSIVTKKDNSADGVITGYKETAFHIRFITKGTRERKVIGRTGRYKGANRGSIKKNTFMWSAFNRATPKVITFFKTNYLQMIDKAIKKQLKKFKKD